MISRKTIANVYITVITVYNNVFICSLLGSIIGHLLTLIFDIVLHHDPGVYILI